MYTTEHNVIRQTKNRAKNTVLQVGTTLVSNKSMKKGFTYKEFSVVAGVVVAIIIALTLWFKQFPMGQSMAGPAVPKPAIYTLTQIAVEKVFALIP